MAVPLTAAEAAAFEVADPSTLSPVALAYLRARNADPMCSFGDFAAVSQRVDLSTALLLKGEVCDGLIAPDFDPEALEVLRAKKKGSFVVLRADPTFSPPPQEFREVFGLCFQQQRNSALFEPSKHLANVVVPQGAGADALSQAAQRDLTLASITVKYTQSNSVGYAYSGQMVL